MAREALRIRCRSLVSLRARSRGALDCDAEEKHEVVLSGGTTGYKAAMDLLRWIASLTTMAAGLVLAARVRPRLMGWAFVALTLASMAWVVIGYFAGEYALMAQNIVITFINIFGIYRWLIWKGKI